MGDERSYMDDVAARATTRIGARREGFDLRTLLADPSAFESAIRFEQDADGVAKRIVQRLFPASRQPMTSARERFARIIADEIRRGRAI